MPPQTNTMTSRKLYAHPLLPVHKGLKNLFLRIRKDLGLDGAHRAFLEEYDIPKRNKIS